MNCSVIYSTYLNVPIKMISFIIPAHNEENWITPCLNSIESAMQSVDEEYELIVVSDASTDSTEEMAQECGAQIIRVNHRQVSAVRNEGVDRSTGDLLFFVDADTQINPKALMEGLDILKSGAVGGGCLFKFDYKIPGWAKMFHRFGLFVGKIMNMTGGCFVFCTREAFYKIGGFSTKLHAGEDMAFVQALKSVGQFKLTPSPVTTSARKLSVVGFWEVFTLVLTILIKGPHYQNKKTLDFMYGQRAQLSRSSLNKKNK